ncbi:MAG: N,N-dimethylformamidase beta subunit family domain-containing protein, partial [Vicinamibacterales bacterium]
MMRAALAIAGLAWLVLSGAPDGLLSAQGCGSNAIVCENANPGAPASEWDVSGSGHASIQGFATEFSVVAGQLQRFKIDTDANNYTIKIYRMGYYGGSGARLISTITPSAALPQIQPSCLTNSAGLIDCGNWGISASWTIPANAVSGIYFARLARVDTGGASHIFFVVRDDTANSDVLFQTSDTTWQAYNSYGGNSLYQGGPGNNPGRAYKVSYNRPFNTRDAASEDFVFNAEYPMVRFLEKNGYSVSYFSGADTDRYAAKLLQHRLFLSVGHDEYWSGGQRA